MTFQTDWHTLQTFQQGNKRFRMLASFKVGLICVKDSKTSNLAKRFRLTALRGNKQVKIGTWRFSTSSLNVEIWNGLYGC